MRSFQGILLSIYVLFAISSCGKKTANFLSLELLPENKAYVLSGNADSCSELGAKKYSIAGPRFDFKQIKMTWVGPNDLYISYLQIYFNDEKLSGEYSCIVEGEELDALFATESSYKKGGRILKMSGDKPIEVTSIADCRLRCGGLNVSEDWKNKVFVVSGKLKVVGSTKDSNGQPLSVKTDIGVLLENIF